MKGFIYLIMLLSFPVFFQQNTGIAKKNTGKSYKAQVVPKGKHSTKWTQRYWRSHKVEDFTLEGKMAGAVRYKLPASDQKDINKYAGVYQKRRPHVRTTIAGFWYDPVLDSVGWTFYHHGINNPDKYRAVGSVPGYVNLSNVIYTAPGDVPDWGVDFANDRKKLYLYLAYEGKMIRDTAQFDIAFKRKYFRGNLYFGGNQKQPGPGSLAAYKHYSSYKVKN